jgi:hypothetical protein
VFRKLLYTEASGDRLLFDVWNDPYEERELLCEGEDASDLEAAMLARLQSQGCEGAKERKLGAVKSETVTLEALRERAHRWPGHHSPGYPCDVLHR